MKYIDLHCDTLMQAALSQRKDIAVMEKAMVDLDRLEKGGCMAQFFAIFMPPMAYRAKYGSALPDDETYIRLLHGILMNTIQLYPGRLALAKSAGDLAANAGKISAFLTLEDGRAVDGKLENLDRFFDLGVRLISLTWNEANCLGAPNSADPAVMAQGLTPFGRDAVRRMNELGMIVDVSHLSDGGFWDVAELSDRPFVASHSNCRSLCAHPRNLTDEMIRALADRGGVAGLNFNPPFLEEGGTHSAVQRIADHARHLADVGGLGCVALGTDFDGIRGTFDVGSPDKMDLLFTALQKVGFTQDQVEQIAWGNAQRLIRDVCS